jgi:hypothetical protein
MDTGSGFFDEEPGARPRQSRTGAAGQGEESRFADVLNSITLDSGRDRGKSRRRKDTGSAEVVWPGASALPPDDVGEQVGGDTDPHRAAASEPEEDLRATGSSTEEEQPVTAEAISVHPAEETAIVRPYAITGGRTKANYALEMETLISTREGVVLLTPPEQFEHRSIVEECRSPRSVAEIAATLQVPLGVARVLISDAADAGLVTVHETVSDNDGAEAHLMLMERVLSGLRRL